MDDVEAARVELRGPTVRGAMPEPQCPLEQQGKPDALATEKLAVDRRDDSRAPRLIDENAR
jgi:hypothetical protein